MLHFAWVLDGIPRNSATQRNSKDTTNARGKGQHTMLFHQQGGCALPFLPVSLLPPSSFQLPASCADACLTARSRGHHTYSMTPRLRAKTADFRCQIRHPQPGNNGLVAPSMRDTPPRRTESGVMWRHGILTPGLTGATPKRARQCGTQTSLC